MSINVTSEAQFHWQGMREALGFRARAALSWLRHGHVARKRVIAAYLDTHETRKLHLGSTYDLEGYLNSQILGPAPIDITSPLPLPDSSFDLIYSSHLVEHIHRKQLHAFLREGFRVLTPGGIHLIATPSLRKIVDVCYGSDEASRKMLFERGAPFYGENFHTACQQINLTMRAFGHRFLYDVDYMKAIGDEIGYEGVQVVPNDAMPDEALNAYIAARKPPRWHVETETFLLRKPEG